jgi:hypothetical protein
MVWAFIIAQVLAMVFLAMLVLGLRDMIWKRPAAAMIRDYFPFLMMTALLIAWSIWLLLRVAPSLEP